MDDYIKFFHKIGGITYNLLAMEFLMRTYISLTQKEENFLQNFKEGELIENPPKSFYLSYFGEVLDRFNELVDDKNKVSCKFKKIRNDFAHGCISEINKDGIQRLIKIGKPTKNNEIRIETNQELTFEKLDQILNKTNKTRQRLMKLINSFNK